MFGAYFINLFARSVAFAECAYPKSETLFLFLRLLFATTFVRSISGPIDWLLAYETFTRLMTRGSGK